MHSLVRKGPRPCPWQSNFSKQGALFQGLWAVCCVSLRLACLYSCQHSALPVLQPFQLLPKPDRPAWMQALVRRCLLQRFLRNWLRNIACCVECCAVQQVTARPCPPCTASVQSTRDHHPRPHRPVCVPGAATHRPAADAFVALTAA